MILMSIPMATSQFSFRTRLYRKWTHPVTLAFVAALAGTLIAQFADAIGCETPLFTLTQPVYTEAMAMGLGDQDTAAVFEVLKKTILTPPKSTTRDRE